MELFGDDDSTFVWPLFQRARAAEAENERLQKEVKKMNVKHPRQPVVMDNNGTERFKRNSIVRYLLDAGPIDLNQLAIIPFSEEDRRQFAQLIGYSLCGYEELGYAEEEEVSDA